MALPEQHQLTQTPWPTLSTIPCFLLKKQRESICVNERMNERTNERTNERMNELLNEERTRYRILVRLKLQAHDLSDSQKIPPKAIDTNSALSGPNALSEKSKEMKE
jgi:uncharacterized protein (DUF2384 family)